MKIEQKLLGKIFLVIFASLFIQSIYKGAITLPSEGDSVDYHIPIAESILNGKVINPSQLITPIHTRFYPANGELILAGLKGLKVPLGLFNVFGIITLFFVSIKLARAYKINVDHSIIFAVIICTLNGVLRWADTQIIDIWLLAFTFLSISLLEKPEKTTLYFLKLGVSFGFLIGMKFSAPFIAIILLIVYFKKVLPFLDIKKIIVFLIPVLIFGASWYIRNYILRSNPFYPQSFLIFPGLKSTILDISVFDVVTGSLSGFIGTLNSFVSEYIVWAFVIPFVVISYLLGKIQNRHLELPKRLLIISILLCAVMINLPSSNETHIMTSSFRYFYSSITIMILFSFIFFTLRKQMTQLIIISLCSVMLIGFPQGFYPKLIVVLVPISLFIYTNGYDVLKSFVKRM